MKSHFLVCWHTLTDRHTDRHTYRQTDTQIDIHIDRQTHRHTETQTHIQTDRHTDRQTDTRTNTQRDTETDTHTHRETDTQTADWQTDRHTDRTVLWRLVTILTARYFIITCRPVRSAAMPVLFLLSGPKNGFFAAQGRQVAPTNVKFGTRLPPPCQITHLSWQKCGNTASKTVKIANFGHKFAP